MKKNCLSHCERNEVKRSNPFMEIASARSPRNDIALSVVLLFIAFFLAADFACAQNMEESDRATNQKIPELRSEENSVIETNINLEQMEFGAGADEAQRPDRPNRDDSSFIQDTPPKAGPDREILKKFDKPLKNEAGLEIKEDQIITINRSLKKIIEENEKLHQQTKELDGQLRQLRGQHNIELNKVNSISVERDAYKNQNEVMSGVTQQYAQDIENLKQQLKEKEAQLAAQPAGTQLPGGTPAPIALGTIQVTQEDREKTQNILVMLEDVKQKGQKLRADEAKVHYNMGNMYFKRKEYRRAKNEFQSALRLRPQDPLSHFNLAFVSGEYLNDYKTAMTHYKEYLDINPHAEDAPLVREKIIEAELIMRAQIPSGLEKDINNETNRINRK